MKLRLHINDTFEAMSVRYRLLHVAADTNKAYVIQLDQLNPNIEAWDLEGLEPCSDMPDVLRRVADPYLQDKPIDPRKADIVTRDRRYERLRGIVHYDERRLKGHPEMWEPQGLRRLLKRHAAKFNATEKTLLHDLRLWLVGGQTKDALLGRYHNCGRIADDTDGRLEITELSRNGAVTVVFAPAKEQARGRNAKCPVGTDTPRYEKFSMPAALREQIYATAKRHWLEDKSKSVYGATVAVLDELFALRDEDGNPLRDEDGGAVLAELGRRPTLHQVRHLLRKAIPLSKAFVDRNSAAEYENDHAPSTGSVQDDCLGPGDVYEIDATVFDMWICARANRAVLLGKATMYLVIDRDSRLIVGFYLTLDPPSWSAAEQAVLSIGCDWEAVCKRLDVQYRASDWPASRSLPNRFFADRGGDVMYYASNAICDGLSVQVTNAPALLSRRKPIVESGHRVVPVPLKQDAQGYEPPKSAFKRRAKKYHRDGCYTLPELAQTALRACIRHNRRQLKGYRQSPEEILGGQSVSPIAIWNRKVGERMGTVARMPLELMRRKMMPRDTAVVKNSGIHFRGLTYKFDASEDGALKEWFVKASLRGDFAVQVTYHPDFVDAIWVRDPDDDRKEYKLVLTTKSGNFEGYSFAELKYVMEMLRDKQLTAESTNVRHDVAARQDIREMSKQLHAEAMAAARGMTPGMRRSGSEEYRRAEAAENRAGVNSSGNDGVQYGSLGAATDRLAHRTAESPTSATNESACGTSPMMPSTDHEEQSTASSSTTDPALMGLF